MREPQYSILADIQDAIERGKTREVGIVLAAHHPTGIPLQKKSTLAEQQAYEQLQSILSEIFAMER